MNKRYISLFAALVCLIGCGSLVSRAATNYVAQGGQTPSANYLDWTTAASNIQDAINVTGDGDTVLVSNGVYDTGATLAPDNPVANRVYITNAITLRSVNGPEVTIIKGSGGNSPRGVYMTNAVALIGFTVTNGQARNYPDASGGGVLAVSSVLISNCVFVANGAYSASVVVRGGGGACLWRGGTVANCVFSNNWISDYPAMGAGLFMQANVGSGTTGTVVNCVFMGNNGASFGGGAFLFGDNVTASNCVFIKNSAWTGGGVAPRANKLVNCLVAENRAEYGGGVGDYTAIGWLENCTIVSNSSYGADYAGGVRGADGTKNCIIWGNYNTGAQTTPNWGDTLNAIYTCTTPLPAGGGNIAVDPLFMNPSATNYHLREDSPCINTGTNQSWMIGAFDLDGSSRIDPRSGIVDMGAYELFKRFIHKGTLITVR